MTIKNIQRWQWVLIAVVLGYIIGSVRNYYGDESFNSYPATMHQEQFERSLVLPIPVGAGKTIPCLTNIHVVPLKSKRTWSYIVAGKRYLYGSPMAALMSQGGKRAQWVPSVFNSGEQFKPFRPSKAQPADTRGSFEKLAERIGLKEPDPPGTVLDYLRRMKTEHNITFTYDWWKQPRSTLIFWTVGSTIIVGGIWPFLVCMMAYGTLLPPAKPKQPKAAKEPKWKPSAPAPVVKKAGPTSADMDQLKAMEAQLEENLKDFIQTASPDDSAAGIASPAPIRKLEATASDASQKPLQPVENKEFDAKADDYYPVERHHKKQ